ncbi:MAG: hypothetical protein CL868_13250 [Cytophagaceae bacterium]|nr:hypothetical protein [Cytophagaceae bacterium]
MKKQLKAIKNRYFIFIITIIVTIIVNQVIVQYNINQKESDASIINIAGRQRMLSQRISKLILFFESSNGQESGIYAKDSLVKVTHEFQKAHIYLSQNSDTNTPKIDSLLLVNEPLVNIIVKASRNITSSNSLQNIGKEADLIFEAEPYFLQNMERIVNAYQNEAERKLANLKKIEIFLSLLSLIILLGEFAFVFIPVFKELLQKNKELRHKNKDLAQSDERLRKNVEELSELKENLEIKEKYNRIFIEQAPTAIAMFDENMHYMAASQQWHDDYDLNGQDIIGQSHYNIFPEIEDSWKAIHQDCLKGAVNKCDEAEITRKDGSKQWLSWEVRPWFIKKNHIGGILMYTADITNIKQTQLEKEKIQEILEKTNDVARIGAWELDVESGMVTWSRITRQIHEVDDNFVPTLDSVIQFYKEGNTRNKMQFCINRAIEKGEPFDVELEIITAKGKVLWTRAIGQAKIIDGICRGVYGVFHDIDALIRSKSLLFKANQELTAIFNSGPISIIGTDPDGLITYFNKGAEEMLQYSAKEVVGIHTPELIHLQKEVELRSEAIKMESGKKLQGFEIFVEKAKTNTYEVREWHYVRKDGSKFPIELIVNAIRNTKNEITGFLGVATDITERIQSKNKLVEAKTNLEILTQKLTAQNGQLASFAHITSHNLRSPVSNLNSLLYLYNVTETEEDKEELFEKFEIVIHHLTDTLDTLVETLKAKELNKITEKIQFAQVFTKTKEMLAAQIMHCKAEIEGDFTQVKSISYNKAYLESIFLNLITNAIKYRSPDRNLIIKVSTSNEGGRTKMSVKDNGLGIDLKKHSHKLFGLNKTFHRHPEAKGLGLFMTKNQIESMGGNITAESEIDKGSNFIVTF